MGNFKEVLHPSVRRDAVSQARSMMEFEDLVQDLQLIDLDINQASTWMR